MLYFGTFKEDFITEVAAQIPNSYVEKMDGAMITIRKNIFTVVLINKTRKMDTEW